MWYAMFMQVIMILLIYQNAFSFTHNDLHTNNVMYVDTDIPYIVYVYKNIKYKVPTFGKIYKIIDFGRSIYQINNTIICSDSYDVKGDSNSQYNFEPFYNPKKDIVLPNPSFDLCRLATSILDFLLENAQQHENILKLIDEWCCDDMGKNVLYKSNGEERYPEFKLYKMIARNVHNHTPEKQLHRDCFLSFVTTNINSNDIVIDIDNIPTFFTNPI
jgi:hypothetical protein